MPDERTTEQENADLKIKLALAEMSSTERNISDNRYARKITETVVFGALIIFALAALYFLFAKAGLPIPSLP